MYEVPMLVTKSVLDVQVGEIINVGGQAYRIAHKESNLFGGKILTLEMDSDERSTVKLIMPSHLMVTTRSSEPVRYDVE